MCPCYFKHVLPVFCASCFCFGPETRGWGREEGSLLQVLTVWPTWTGSWSCQTSFTRDRIVTRFTYRYTLYLQIQSFVRYLQNSNGWVDREHCSVFWDSVVDDLIGQWTVDTYVFWDSFADNLLGKWIVDASVFWDSVVDNLLGKWTVDVSVLWYSVVDNLLSKWTVNTSVFWDSVVDNLNGKHQATVVCSRTVFCVLGFSWWWSK